MNVKEFINNYKPAMHEYCPVIITSNGDVYDSEKGHLQTLVSISGDPDVLSTIPKDVSSLLYLAGKLGCVIVDYENQIYMDYLTEEQEQALNTLVQSGLIADHRIRMSNETAKI